MRRYFDSIFADASRSHPQRFCWDYWDMDEYTLLRTPAYHFFPKPIYESFHRHLVQWGRENLGCHDISPPWMSCYVEGCKQDTHQDLPHGPLAFVFSLTPWQGRRFRGGETFLGEGRTQKLVPAKFNRLIVFDPSVPHGVRKVSGTQKVNEGRLVIHGWFVQPRPFLVGSLAPKKVYSVLDEQLPDVLHECLPRNLKTGFISYRLDILPSGKVKSALMLADTAGAHQFLSKSIMRLQFPKAKASTRLTLPVQLG